MDETLKKGYTVTREVNEKERERQMKRDRERGKKRSSEVMLVMVPLNSKLPRREEESKQDGL